MSVQKKDPIGGIPNEKYCKRLVELAFPSSFENAAPAATVLVKGQPYSRDELRAALEERQHQEDPGA